MEIVQTGIDTCMWCMGMFGARFAVFVRRARVLPGPLYATRNLSFLRFHRRRHPVVSSRCFTGNSTGWCFNLFHFYYFLLNIYLYIYIVVISYCTYCTCRPILLASYSYHWFDPQNTFFQWPHP